LSNLFRWPVVFLTTWAVSIVGSMPVFLTGLAVRESVSRPLTLFAVGILAALAASWTSNRLAGRRSRIPVVVAASETAAIVLVVLLGIFNTVRFSPNIVNLLAWAAIVSLTAAVSAFYFRNSTASVKKDVILSVVLLVLAPVAVVGTIIIASQFGLTGA
jgi:hypothetical protein